MRKGSAGLLSEVNPDDRASGRRDMSFKKKDEKVAGLEGRVEGCVPARGELHEPLQAPPVTGEHCDPIQRGLSRRKVSWEGVV